jgi:hypothetical protein
MNHYESSIEAKFCTQLHKWAVKQCITLEILKLNLSGRRGWPDRMILWERRNAVFVEFKAVGEKPRPLQAYVHNIIDRLGFTVLTYDNAEEALNDVKTIISATTPPAKGAQPFDEREWS